MSDSWISWNPRIDEPSNPRPSSKTSSVSSWAGIEKCCMSPGRSQNRMSTMSTSSSVSSFSTSLGVATAHRPFLDVPGSSDEARRTAEEILAANRAVVSSRP